MEDRLRRAQLQRLDSILDRLERLNLEESNRLTGDLRRDLEAAGIRIPAKPNVSELIERVWELQEEFLEREESGEVAARRQLS
ncbi:MAG TPA: hypothetical protein VGR61_07945 [Candidatus Dormibacteraeota bacterium]|nr:hypothetical protein [Candidatus Dormibacteraeota bacterium]